MILLDEPGFRPAKNIFCVVIDFCLSCYTEFKIVIHETVDLKGVLCYESHQTGTSLKLVGNLWTAEFKMSVS